MKERVKIPSTQIPVIPLRNTVLFPGQVVPVVIGRPRSRAAVERAMEGERLVVLVAQNSDTGDREPSMAEIYRVGVVEKRIAAHRAGIKKILLPRRNERDLREVPDEVKNQLEITLVSTVDELLAASLNLPLITSGSERPEFDSNLEFA